MPIFIKWWRELLILFLLAAIGFGGWYFTASKANLKNNLFISELSLTVSKENESKLRVAVANQLEHLLKLKTLNGKLELDVSTSQQRIDFMEANPQILFRNVYKTILPEQCAAKFDWLKDQAIKINEKLK